MTHLKMLCCAAGAAIALSGCQTLDESAEVPARITNPTAASQAALQSAVNEALSAEVRLADSALTDSSLLIIELNPPRSMQHPESLGRSMTPPVQFLLVADGEACVLIDRRNGNRYVLQDTTCEPE